MTGEEILDRVREFTGYSGLSGYEEINDAYETILRRGGLWSTRVRDESSVTIKNNEKFYALPMDRIRRLESVWVKDNADFLEWRPLYEVAEVGFEKTVFQYRKADGTDRRDAPREYRLSMSEGQELEVSPTPDGTYACRLIYIGNPPPIARQVTPILPSNYHRIIAKLAAVNYLSNKPDEASQVKAAGLRTQVREALFNMAFDVSPNRSGLHRKRQMVMRA